MIWIKVQDRLPEMKPDEPNSEDVLSYVTSHGKHNEFGIANMYPQGAKYMALDRYIEWSDKDQPSFRSDRYSGKVTHWMPLPEKPQ